jgi:hypothetical protein
MAQRATGSVADFKYILQAMQFGQRSSVNSYSCHGAVALANEEYPTTAIIAEFDRTSSGDQDATIGGRTPISAIVVAEAFFSP